MPSEIQTAIIVVDGFEKWGEITVRQRTVRDSMISIPVKVDELLKGTPNPGNYQYNAAYAIAIAQFAILEPVGLVEQILSSPDENDINFFYRFSREYSGMNQDFFAAAQAKKSGETIGSESNLQSDTTVISSQPTIDG